MQSHKQQLISGIAYSAIAKYSGVIMSLIVTAILARLLSPDDFGVVAIAIVIISFLSLFSSFGIEPAIIQFKNLTKKDLSNIFSFTFWSGVLFTIFFFFLSWPISNYYNSEDLLLICQLLSVNLFFATINIVPNSLLYKEKQFKFIAYRTLIVQSIGGVASIIAAILGLGIFSLVINPIFSSIIISIINFKKYPQKLQFTFGIESIKIIFSFSIYQFLFSIINFFSKNLDKLIIGKYLGMSPLGYYEKSYRLMMLPLQNITHIISPVAHPIFSEFQYDLKKLAISYERMIRFLSLVGLPLSVLLYFTAKELILIVFGNNWLPSVSSFEILSISVGIQIILSTSGSIFLSSNSTKYLFICGLTTSVLTVTSVLMAAYLYKSIESVAWVITITLFINFIQVYLIMYIGVFKRSILFFARQLFSSLVLVSILILANLVFSYIIDINNVFISFSCKVILNGALYLVFIQLSGEFDIANKIKLFTNRIK